MFAIKTETFVGIAVLVLNVMENGEGDGTSRSRGSASVNTRVIPDVHGKYPCVCSAATIEFTGKRGHFIEPSYSQR